MTLVDRILAEYTPVEIVYDENTLMIFTNGDFCVGNDHIQITLRTLEVYGDRLQIFYDTMPESHYECEALFSHEEVSWDGTAVFESKLVDPTKVDSVEFEFDAVDEAMEFVHVVVGILAPESRRDK